jgi:hypothetical protein
MERKTLPAREKQVSWASSPPRPPRPPDAEPEDEWHLFCPGEGCSARLGSRRLIPQGFRLDSRHVVGQAFHVTTLETRYTDEPHPDYAPGTWWRQRLGGYQGMPSQRDIRKAHQRGQKLPDPCPDSSTPEAHNAVMAFVRYGFSMAVPKNPKPAPRRDSYRPHLRPGRHVVICYKCGGAATIDTPP